MSRIVALETDYARLTRDVAESKSRLGALESKSFSAEIAAQSEMGGYNAQIVVLDPAYRPTAPSTMGRGRVAMIGFLASIIMALGLAVVRGLFFDDRIFESSDVERFGVPVLVVVPKGAKLGA